MMIGDENDNTTTFTGQKISRYRLSKISGVPWATLADIYSGKTRLDRSLITEEQAGYLRGKYLGMVKEEKTILLQQNAEEYALSIVLKTIPEMHMVSYRNTILEFSEEGHLWGELTKECEIYHIAVNTNSVAMAIQHMICSEKNEIDVEVLLSTNKEQKACGNLKFRKFPERQVASIIFKGSYSQIGRINIFVERWLETNHYEICDKAFSIYYNSPRESQSVDQFVTELCFPVCEKSS